MAFDLSRVRQKTAGEARLDDGKFGDSIVRIGFGAPRRRAPTS